MITFIVTIAAALLLSLVGIEAFRRWSLTRGFFDIPNERSSHSQPTPRGAGIVIVALTLLGYITINVAFDRQITWGFVIGAVMVAGISWIDDLVSISSASRFIVHVAAAALLIIDAGYWETVPVPFWETSISLGWFGMAFTALWIVWLINAFNFMDGIDGIAGLQAALAGVAWSVLSYLEGLKTVSAFSAMLAAVCLGFLVHNWQPARIFMGDVGSAFLGFTLAALPLLAGNEALSGSDTLVAAGAIFVWFFVFDTIFTFFKRLFKGHRVWEAHREHIYQRMIISGMEHQTVTLIYGTFTAIVAGVYILATEFRGSLFHLTLFLVIALTLGLFVLARNRSVNEVACR